MDIYEVGGAVRDALLGIPSKDVDFVVVTPGGYDAMRKHLVDNGFRIFLENPEFVTIRAQVPENHPLRARTKDADFVLARKDGPTKDGRRPEYVEPGSLADDLARRDFTVNALARAIDGTIIDLHGGRDDLEWMQLRFVGDPITRIKEDGLRVMRAWRFHMTKGFLLPPETREAINSETAAEMLQCVSIERIYDELLKIANHDPIGVIGMLADAMHYRIRDAVLRDGLRLVPTLKGRKPPK